VLKILSHSTSGISTGQNINREAYQKMQGRLKDTNYTLCVTFRQDNRRRLIMLSDAGEIEFREKST